MRLSMECDEKLLTKKEFTALFDVVDQCRECGSAEALKRLMGEVCGMVGSECCMGMFIAIKARKKPHSVDILSAGCPETWARAYFEQAHGMGASEILNSPERFRFLRMNAESVLTRFQSDDIDGQEGLDLDRGFACGVRDGSSDGGSIYVFARADDRRPARAEAILGRAMPHLHAAWGSLLEKKRQTGNGELTAQEITILEGLRDGRNDAEIGVRTGISAHTVRFHLRNIMRKLGAKNRIHVLALALRKNQIKI